MLKTLFLWAALVGMIALGAALTIASYGHGYEAGENSHHSPCENCFWYIRERNASQASDDESTRDRQEENDTPSEPPPDGSE